MKRSGAAGTRPLRSRPCDHIDRAFAGADRRPPRRPTTVRTPPESRPSDQSRRRRSAHARPSAAAPLSASSSGSSVFGRAARSFSKNSVRLFFAVEPQSDRSNLTWRIRHDRRTLSIAPLYRLDDPSSIRVAPNLLPPSSCLLAQVFEKTRRLYEGHFLNERL